MCSFKKAWERYTREQRGHRLVSNCDKRLELWRGKRLPGRPAYTNVSLWANRSLGNCGNKRSMLWVDDIEASCCRAIKAVLLVVLAVDVDAVIDGVSSWAISDSNPPAIEEGSPLWLVSVEKQGKCSVSVEELSLSIFICISSLSCCLMLGVVLLLLLLISVMERLEEEVDVLDVGLRILYFTVIKLKIQK